MVGRTTPPVESKGSLVNGIMVFLVLLIAAGGGGFALGFFQKFHPIEAVAPSASAEPSTTGSTTSSGGQPAAVSLKKAYWIHSRGYNRAGYAIRVYINGGDVGTFQTPERIVDVTKFVRLGDNKIRFVATALPAGNRTDNQYAHLTLELFQGEKYSAHGYKNGEKLVEYERRVTETENFDDQQDFAVVE